MRAIAVLITVAIHLPLMNIATTLMMESGIRPHQTLKLATLDGVERRLQKNNNGSMASEMELLNIENLGKTQLMT